MPDDERPDLAAMVARLARSLVDAERPVLAAHGVTASVYVVAGKLSGGADWVSGGPLLPLMSADDVRAAEAAGHEIGNHTSTHARLSELERAAGGGA